MIFADADDAPIIADLAKRICYDYYYKIVDKGLVDYYVEKYQSEEAIREQIKSEGYLYSFIMSEGKKVGYFSIRSEEDALLISKLYLEEDHRGKGLGSQALDSIIEYGRSAGMKYSYLHVNKNNVASIEIYKSKGFLISRYDDSDIDGGFKLDDYIMEYSYER
jgi:Sortase and related acyltransferases